MKTIVSVVNCASYNEREIYNAVKKSFSTINFEFKRNSSVLIKPSVLSHFPPEKHITTHPSVIDAICRILKEKDCKIMIGESSGAYKEGGTSAALKISGIKEVADKYNIKLMPFEESPIKKITDPNAKVLKEINIAKPIFEADLVINVPKMKTHELMIFTGAVKNLLGTLPGGLKQKCHLIAKDNNDFGELLLDIYQNIKPGLNIMDGIVGLEGEGPGSGGTPKKTGVILASENAVALDIVAERIAGIKPKDIATTRNAVRRGLFSGYNDIDIVGEFTVIPYKTPKSFMKNVPEFLKDFVFRHAIIFPQIDEGKCERCMVCVKVCPAKAINIKDKVVFVDREECINCYCCHEMCPHKAIELKGSKLIETIRKVRDLTLGGKNRG